VRKKRMWASGQAPLSQVHLGPEPRPWACT
jgi:hypothetical protein